MTLDQYLANGQPDYSDAQGRALVFGTDLRDRLEAVQSEHGDPRYRVNPVSLIDGRCMLNADVLTEINGIFQSGFSHLDPSLFAQVEVMPWTDAIALLPQPEEVTE